jgi:hypothetical protein
MAAPETQNKPQNIFETQTIGNRKRDAKRQTKYKPATKTKV